jgi:hypothetical protein
MELALPKTAFCLPIKALKSPLRMLEVPTTELLLPDSELPVGSSDDLSSSRMLEGRAVGGGGGQGIAVMAGILMV